MAHDVAEIRASLNIDIGTPVVTTDARSRDEVKKTVLTLLDVVLSRAMARSDIASAG